MKRFLILAAFALLAVAGAIVAVPSAVGIPTPCASGTQLSPGQVSITFPSSSTAQANVTVNWAFCGENVTGYTTSWGGWTTSVSPGQTVSVTVWPCTDNDGCLQPYFGASASATAPSSGGCTSNCGTSTPQCSDGADNDGNGAIDMNDTGCSSPSDTTESGGAPRTTTTTPPPPTTTTTQQVDIYQPLTTFGLTTISATDIPGPTSRTLASGSIQTCPAGARWKVRVYRADFNGSILGGVSFDVQYGVCYVPSSRIVFASAWAPVNAHSSFPWSWLQTVDSGYPSIGPITEASATFRWQGSAAVCFLGKGCGPTRHPGIQIVFKPNNTEVISEWGG